MAYITATLAQVPSEGNILIAVIGATDTGDLAAVNQVLTTGVSWHFAVRSSDRGQLVEIWWGLVESPSAGTSVSMDVVRDAGATAVVAEYAGLVLKAATPLDRTASRSVDGTAHPETGQTPETRNKAELWVGGFAIHGGEAVTSPSHGFAIDGQQATTGFGADDVNTAFVSRVVSALGIATTGVLTTLPHDVGGAIAAFYGALDYPVITAIDPEILPADGGHELTLEGSFDASRYYRVHVGPLGSHLDPNAYKPSGRGYRIKPDSPTAMTVRTPILDAGSIASVYVERDDDILLAGSFPDCLRVVSPEFQNLVFAMRRKFPPNYQVGPRDFTAVPRVSRPENLLIRSEALDLWPVVGLSVTGAEPDPGGGSTGGLLTEDGSTGGHYTGRVLAGILDAGSAYTLAVYLKADARSWVALRVYDVSGAAEVAIAFFDLVAGDLGVSRGCFPEIREEVGGWYRCSLTWRALVVGSIATRVHVASADDALLFVGSGGPALRMAWPSLDPWPVPRLYRTTGEDPVS